MKEGLECPRCGATHIMRMVKIQEWGTEFWLGYDMVQYEYSGDVDVIDVDRIECVACGFEEYDDHDWWKEIDA